MQSHSAEGHTLAESKHRPKETQQAKEPRGEEPGRRELRRLSETFEAQWQDWIQGGATEESQCLQLTEMVYALSDLHTRAQEMRLDFLGYLLGMALQEALAELRAKDSHDYPMPPTR